MEFVYRVATPDGRTETGTLEGGSVREVVAVLKEKGYVVISVSEQRAESRFGALRRRFIRVSATERVLLARHLALILRAGLPIDRALNILQSHGRNRGLQQVLREAQGFLQNGESLSAALERYPTVFPPHFIAVIRWGEAGGSLVESLEHLATQLEKDHDLRVKVRSALVYPTIVVGATIAVGAILSVYILPRLITLFEAFKVQLPLSTRIFLAVARFLLSYGLYALPLIVALPVALVFLSRTPRVRPLVQRALLRLPVFGSLIRQVNLARFDRIFGSLLRSGIPVVEALAITRDSLGNVLYRRALDTVLKAAREGVPLGRDLGQSRLFPPIQVQMIVVGEATGKLADVLIYLAEFTERDIDARTKNLATAIEPLLLLGVGIIVGGVALAVITPIYQLTASFSK